MAESAGIDTLNEQVRSLLESHREIKELLREVVTRLADAERRALEACKECAMWNRVNTLEKEMAGINGRIAGVSLGAAALAFLATWFVRR